MMIMMASFPMFRAILLMIKYTAHNWRKRRIGFISIRIDCTAHTLTSSSAYSKNKYYDHSIV